MWRGWQLVSVRTWNEGSLTSLRTLAHMSLLRLSSSSAFFSIAAFRSARACAAVSVCAPTHPSPPHPIPRCNLTPDGQYQDTCESTGYNWFPQWPPGLRLTLPIGYMKFLKS